MPASSAPQQALQAAPMPAPSAPYKLHGQLLLLLERKEQEVDSKLLGLQEQLKMQAKDPPLHLIDQKEQGSKPLELGNI